MSSAVSVAPTPAPVAALPSLYRLSVAQYQAMVERHILTEAERVELLRGLLVAKMTPQPPHAIAVDLVHDALRGLLPPGWHVRTQALLLLSDSVPEPDDCVTRGERRDYCQRHPDASDVALVVEVADTTLAYDRTLKKVLYAEAGIPAYWIVNLVDRLVEVYSQPQGSDYVSVQTLGSADLVPVVLNGQTVGSLAIAQLLP